MDGRTVSGEARRDRRRARRARRSRVRAGTATAEDRASLVDDIVGILNPTALRVAEISATFDHGGASAARRAAASMIIRGEGAWPTDNEFGPMTRPLTAEVVDTLAAAYGVPAWFLTNTGTEPLADIELGHELRRYRTDQLHLTRYDAHACPADPVIDSLDTRTLVSSARHALTANMFAHAGFGILGLVGVAFLVMIGVATITTAVWLGGLTFVIAAISAIGGARAWWRDLRTVLNARKLPPAEFTDFVQVRLQRHVGNTLKRRFTTPTAHGHVQRIICHGATIGYSTLTDITDDPDRFIRDALHPSANL